MRRIAIFVLAAALAGCATATPPSQVTRFHRIDSATMSGATFLIERPADQQGPDGLWVTYASAVAAEMQGAGFRCVADFGSACVGNGPGQAPRHRVVVRIEDLPYESGNDRGTGVGVGVGGSTGSYGSGVGVGVGLDLTRLISGPGPDRLLRLSARINDANGQSIWEGRAETAVRSRAPAGQPGLAAARLASALFQGFPGQSGETITVP
jgi:hypothetical protein